MKKFFLASVVAFVGLSLVAPSALLAQGSTDTISIKDPAEYNAYNNAITQTDAKAKASASESFLTQYPQSIVKKTVLDGLMDAYSTFDQTKAADAATRLLQVDPNNLKAMYVYVAVKKQSAGALKGDALNQTLDDAAAMAQKGLAATKPAGVADADFTKQKSTSDPFFHSALAMDARFSKKDLKGAISEYRTELQLDDAADPASTKSGPALNDTLALGQTYSQLDPPDMINAVWFLARAENFAPDSYKPVIDKQAKYWYKRYHGSPDGFDAVMAKAALTVFPPGDLVIKPADTPADIANKVVADTPDLTTLALGDKEFILANASKENAEKLWALLKDKLTEVPGVVIAATTTQIQVAVTDDAKTDKKADFTVNMKTPLDEKDVPAVGSTFVPSPTTPAKAPAKGAAPAPEAKTLTGTYDSYTQSPAQIIVRDGEITSDKPKKAAPAKKPAAGHHKAS